MVDPRRKATMDCWVDLHGIDPSFRVGELTAQGPGCMRSRYLYGIPLTNRRIFWPLLDNYSLSGWRLTGSSSEISGEIPLDDENTRLKVATRKSLESWLLSRKAEFPGSRLNRETLGDLFDQHV